MGIFDTFFSDYQKKDKLYQRTVYSPAITVFQKYNVPKLLLTEKEAVSLGWSFRKKSKHIRITNYHGKETDVIVPAKIGNRKVNELAKECFADSHVRSVEMPDTVTKLGMKLFDRKTTERVVFSDNITHLPNCVCDGCENLKEVHLPFSLFSMGDYAFFRCRNLTHIDLSPPFFYHMGKELFAQSGLQTFSVNQRFGYPLPINGTIFRGTPLQSLYQMVALYQKNNKIDVIIVGYRSKIKFSKGSSVIMEKNSVDCDCQLDFSRCDNVEFQTPVYANWIENNSYMLSGVYYADAIIRKEDFHKLAFPKWVRVTHPDGISCEKNLRVSLSENEDTAYITVMNNQLLFRSISEKKKTIFLFSHNNRGLFIRHGAIESSALQNIDLGYFSSYGNAEIFAPCCFELHNVTWHSFSSDIHKHIPPSSLFGKDYHGRHIHIALMKAFSYQYSYFYRQEIIDEIFRKGYIIEKDYPFTKVKLNQKDKILIAIDILRGTLRNINGQREERQMYKDYLNRHKRYAKIVCENLCDDYPEYAEFLTKFSENS